MKMDKTFNIPVPNLSRKLTYRQNTKRVHTNSRKKAYNPAIINQATSCQTNYSDFNAIVAIVPQ